MGCGGSTQPGPPTSEDKPTSDSPVESFSASPGRDTPQSSVQDGSSKHTREETLARQREDNVRVTESPTFSSPSSVSGRFGAQESALPDPFSQNRREQQPSPDPFASPAGGYTKEKDTRKRGGFDPEKFRQANGRGGMAQPQLSSSLGVQMMQQQQPQDFSANSFNAGGAMNREGGRLGQNNLQGSQSMSFSGGYAAADQSQQMWSPPPQQEFSQQNYIPNPDFSTNPKVLDMNSGINSMASPGMSGSMHSLPNKPNYGALGWDQHSQSNSIGSPGDSSVASPNPARDTNTNLNKTDEQELDDILDELGEL